MLAGVLTLMAGIAAGGPAHASARPAAGSAVVAAVAHVHG